MHLWRRLPVPLGYGPQPTGAGTYWPPGPARWPGKDAPIKWSGPSSFPGPSRCGPGGNRSGSCCTSPECMTSYGCTKASSRTPSRPSPRRWRNTQHRNAHTWERTAPVRACPAGNTRRLSRGGSRVVSRTAGFFGSDADQMGERQNAPGQQAGKSLDACGRRHPTGKPVLRPGCAASRRAAHRTRICDSVECLSAW